MTLYRPLKHIQCDVVKGITESTISTCTNQRWLIMPGVNSAQDACICMCCGTARTCATDHLHAQRAEKFELCNISSAFVSHGIICGHNPPNLLIAIKEQICRYYGVITTYCSSEMACYLVDRIIINCPIQRRNPRLQINCSFPSN